MDVDNNPQAWQSMLPPSDVNNCFSVLGARFEVPRRYRIQRAIGQGAYGIVCSADDCRTNTSVAIKKITGVVENTIDCKRTLREIRLLRHFDHNNIIKLKDVYIPAQNGANFQDVYTVTELMSTDLHQIISSEQLLTDEHIQYFGYQILRALKYIHSCNVLHRDLKPSNILVDTNCDLKVCDFGLARGSLANQRNLTAYVATRWYRAPELMLTYGYTHYTQAVDIWSVGCILAEILRRKPLFPGRDTMNQLHLVTDVTGTPSPSDLQSINLQKGHKYVQDNLMNRPRRSMEELFPEADEQLRDLLSKMLVFNPMKRITVDEALRHPYMVRLHDPADEPLCNVGFDFDIDDTHELSKDALRKMIWEETQLYRQRDAQSFGVMDRY